MPVIVGVFIRPGSYSHRTMARPNRCFEYDAVDDSYVRFVLNEVLPTVAEKYKLKLSDKGNDRCITTTAARAQYGIAEPKDSKTVTLIYRTMATSSSTGLNRMERRRQSGPLTPAATSKEL